MQGLMDFSGTGARRQVCVASLVCLALGVSLAIAGCDSNLQQQLDDKKTERYNKAAAELVEVEKNRTAALHDSLPKADAKAQGRRHPLMIWRSEFYTGKTVEGEEGVTTPARDDQEKLETIVGTYKGTPTEVPARMGVGFAGASKDWWGGKGNLERYYRFLQGYLSEAKEEDEEAAGNDEYVRRPFTHEARFDLLFVHANRYFQAASLSLDQQLTSALSYWQLAFNIPTLAKERFSGYVTRLCRVGRFKAGCRGVPHELRPLAIQKPYLEWNLEKTNNLLATKPPEVFKAVAERFHKSLTASLKALEAAGMEREDPDNPDTWKLPSTVSGRGVSSGLPLAIGEGVGVRLHTAVVSESFDGKIPRALAAQALETIQTLKDTPGNMIDFERVVLEMPPTAKGKDLVDVVGSFPRDTVRQFDLVGRRRVDASLKRAGVLLRIPADDESRTTSYQFPDMKKKKSCTYLGIAGKPAIGRKSPGSYLVISKKDGIRAAKLSREPETRELIVGEDTLKLLAVEADQVGPWADENEGIIRLFMDGSYTYEQIMRQVSSILYRCVDKQVPLDDRGKEIVTVPCGKSEGRDITLVMGICK